MNISKLSPSSQLFYDSINSEKQLVSNSDTIKLDTYKKIKERYEEETGEYVVLPMKRSTKDSTDDLFW